MYGVLQGKYDDVETELNVMRDVHLRDKILFVGGDGLSILRINHLLAQHPDLYIDQTPVIVPVQGEAPHGVYHVMHAGWRLYWRFILRASLVLGMGDWLKQDPLVKHFNSHLFFLYKLIRACSEYIVIILRTPGAVGLDLFEYFQRAAERNIDFAWVFHFLNDFGFLLLDFKQSVRAGRSQNIDLLWAEFFALGHTSTANKTQYVPMAIMRVWWSEALNPRIAALYHSIRCIPMTMHQGSMVGWDFPCEHLNGSLTNAVHHATEDALERHLRTYSFTHHSYQQLRYRFLGHRADHESFMKDMDADVQIIVEWLLDCVGRTWSTATARNTVSRLGITRGVAPWDEMARSMSQTGGNSVPSFVARHARNLTRGFFTFDP